MKSSTLLHNHPKLENELGLDKNHVIVDREDWETALTIIKNSQLANKSRIVIIGHSGLEGLMCGINEARSIFIRDEDILKYPELPIIDRECLEDSEKYLGEFVVPLEKFEPLNVAIKKANEAIGRLGEQMNDYSFQEKKKHKGYERPYKYHR